MRGRGTKVLNTRYRERTTEISRLQLVNDVRTHHLHVQTTTGLKPTGHIVAAEGLTLRGCCGKMGFGARARRRGTVGLRPWAPAPALVLQDGLVRVGAGGRADRWFLLLSVEPTVRPGLPGWWLRSAEGRQPHGC